jgi:UDP-2-acetamido-2,6-beta-L-arabino-hexul-4-ose reductase
VTTALVTGAGGFIGRNLCVRLGEIGVETIGIGRDHSPAELADGAAKANVVFHIAGINRAADDSEFAGNVAQAEELCAALAGAGSRAPLVFASSVHATRDTVYGRSKRGAEQAFERHSERTGQPVHIFRLPNVFGKWARPNYNSAVATFCHNVARGLPITVNDPAARLELVYVDDVVEAFVALMRAPPEGSGFREVIPVHSATVGELAEMIRGFHETRRSMTTARVGTGLTRALYSTYLSYLPPQDFAYDVPVHADPRGVFVEMLKTEDSGQFSYFTAGEGITRGGHYHHTKAEKFLVISGTARFGFRHIVTGEKLELTVRGGEGRIVETIPGWTHDITNIGNGELVVMLWANEVFDRDRPDTVAMQV